MFKTTISKLNQACMLNLMPRILRGDIRSGPDRYEKLSVCVQSRVAKSTTSGKRDQEEQERCRRIIDQAFAPNPPITDMIDIEAKDMIHIVTPEIPTSPEIRRKKCQKIIDQLFAEEEDEGRKRDEVGQISIPLIELQATTVKENIETLAQKVEHIDETPVVEAPAKRKLEGFNVQPKVIGSKIKRRISERNTAVLHSSGDKSIYGRRKVACKKENRLDELAKRCLDSPTSHIDERLLKEIEKLGVPPTGRRGSRRRSKDAGIVQPEIMKRPRRPVSKTDLDILMIKARLFVMNSEMPPPFEVTPIKADSKNLGTLTEKDEIVLHYERIPPLKEQVLEDTIAIKDDSEVNTIHPVFYGPEITYQERPPQQLLGQLTKVAMSDSNSVQGPSSELEQLIDRQTQKCEQFNKETCSDPKIMPNDCGDDKISVLKIKDMKNNCEEYMPPEKLASTHILSELVDPKEISPRSHAVSMITEEIEMLKNLLRTRFEYLTPENVKKLHPTDYTSTGAVPVCERAVLKEFSESEVSDTLKQLGINQLNPENSKQNHLKEDLINKNNTIRMTELSVLIKECTEAHPKTENEQVMSKTRTHKENLATRDQQHASNPSDIEVDPKLKETRSAVMEDGAHDAWQVLQDPTPRDLSVNKDNLTVSQRNDPNSIVMESQPEFKDYRSANYNFVSPDHMDAKGLEQLSHDIVRYRETNQLHVAPVIAVETARQFVIQESKADQQVVEHRDPLSSTNTNLGSKKTILNPLLDRGAVPNVGVQEMSLNMTHDTTIPAENIQPGNVAEERTYDQPMLLSEMLKRVRERNRMQFLKQLYMQMAETQMHPLLGSCGKDPPPFPPPPPTCPPTPPCPSPPPVCPPPAPSPCPPTRPPCPKPCRAKCPSTCPPKPCDSKPKCPPPPPPPPSPKPCDPCPPSCPPNPCKPTTKPKCPPAKKNPCQKFKKCKCSTVMIHDALSLLLYLGPQLHISPKSIQPLITYTCNNPGCASRLEPEVMRRLFTSFYNLCSMVANMRNEMSYLEPILGGEDFKDYTKTYDPWVPIPSWPIPLKEEKKKLVCPKDGCKVPPPKLNPECRVRNEDSPVLARSFFRTDWTKPKFNVCKPYSDSGRKEGAQLKIPLSKEKPMSKSKENVVQKNKKRQFSTLSSCETRPLNCPTCGKQCFDSSANIEKLKSDLNLELLLLPPMATVSYVVIQHLGISVDV